MDETLEVKSFGKITAKKGANARTPYPHQAQAMERLSMIDKEESFRTLVVLPTGGGKTYTASCWLLKHALDKKKKILWLAHRQMLLDQAAESFQKFAYAESLMHNPAFSYRIVSGSSEHDRAVNISPEDDLLIAGKDSIGRNLSRLDSWLEGEEDLYLVVDEAHHSIAKTYRKIIDYVQLKVKNVKLIGLTATPFRTAGDEQGLLAKIYTDGIDQSGNVAKNAIGITYQIGLKELIKAQILARPIFEGYFTEEDYGETLGKSALEKIQYLDKIPDDIANDIAQNAARNRLIVNTYMAKQAVYGQTIVFALNINHAIALSKIFNESGVPTGYIVSGIKDLVTGVTVSREENDRKLEEYRQGKLKVLINVNILTEGVDLPKTKTVFLARPTVSTILMTQMVGRALRGVDAGGTEEAYIVSFVDQWNEHIAWVNPESLFMGNNDFADTEAEYIQKSIRTIAISKIEEFAKIMDDSIDTALLEKVPFIQRIPVGMYAFNYLERKDGEEESMDLSYQVMVYNSTQKEYKSMMENLQALFNEYHLLDKEYLDDSTLEELAECCRNSYFYEDMIPPYEKKDIIHILKYFAYCGKTPEFYTFDEVTRNKLDIAQIAKHIWEERMNPVRQKDYLNELWDKTDDNMLRLFFGSKKLYFIKQVSTELMKLNYPDIYEEENNVVLGRKALEDLPLEKIKEVNPQREHELREGAFEAVRMANSEYQCALCKRIVPKVLLQVDHIIPMGQGGKSVPENLQILCRKCNGKKRDD